MVQPDSAPESRPRTRRQAWEHATNIPMLALAVAFVGVYAWQVLDTGASPRLDTWLTVTDIAIWAVFATDFGIRVWLSTDRWRFVRRRPIEVLIVLLPPFRPLRLMRAALLMLDSLNRSRVTRARLAIFVGTSSLLIMFLCSLAFFDAEYGAPESKILNFGDALWWSMVSVTTVGYGDVYPVTTEGRFIALILMTLGIGLISFAIGTATSWVLDQLKAVEVSTERADQEIGLLVAEVRALRAEVAALRGTEAQDGGPVQALPGRTSPVS